MRRRYVASRARFRTSALSPVTLDASLVWMVAPERKSLPSHRLAARSSPRSCPDSRAPPPTFRTCPSHRSCRVGPRPPKTAERPEPAPRRPVGDNLSSAKRTPSPICAKAGTRQCHVFGPPRQGLGAAAHAGAIPRSAADRRSKRRRLGSPWMPIIIPPAVVVVAVGPLRVRCLHRRGRSRPTGVVLQTLAASAPHRLRLSRRTAAGCRGTQAAGLPLRRHAGYSIHPSGCRGGLHPEADMLATAEVDALLALYCSTVDPLRRRHFRIRVSARIPRGGDDERSSSSASTGDLVPPFTAAAARSWATRRTVMTPARRSSNAACAIATSCVPAPSCWPGCIGSTTNLCLDRLRVRQGARLVPLDEELPALEAVHAEPRHAESRLVHRDSLRRLFAAVEGRTREVAVYLYVDGMTQQEVAQVAGMTDRSVRNHVARLRDAADRLGLLREAS